MDKEDVIEEWIKYAEMDRETVDILFNSYNKPYEIICYHCEQAVEKYLKACLIMFDIPVIKTHDLIELNLMCINKNDLFSTIEKECSDLTDYGIQVRYPFHKFDLTEIDVQQAIQAMEKVCNFVINILEQYLKNYRKSK